MRGGVLTDLEESLSIVKDRVGRRHLGMLKTIVVFRRFAAIYTIIIIRRTKSTLAQS